MTTEAQSKVIKFIETFSLKNGYPPSVAEIAENANVNISRAHQIISSLKIKGILSWENGKSRTIRILKKGA